MDRYDEPLETEMGYRYCLVIDSRVNGKLKENKLIPGHHARSFRSSEKRVDLVRIETYFTEVLSYIFDRSPFDIDPEATFTTSPPIEPDLEIDFLNLTTLFELVADYFHRSGPHQPSQ